MLVASLTSNIYPRKLLPTTSRSSTSQLALEAIEHALEECARFLHALPRNAPSSDAALALTSNAEQAYDLVQSAHGGMAAGALVDSLRVASEARQSYVGVYGKGRARGATGQCHLC